MPTVDELNLTIADQLGVKATSALDTKQLALVLNVKTSTLDAWTSRGKGPRYLKVGKRRFYRVSDVAEWLLARLHETR